MKYAAILFTFVCLGTTVFALDRKDTSKEGLRFVNIIEGTVYDPAHNPVPDLWVELQNEFGLNLMRIRTGASGRFTFSGIGQGRYNIKVYTSGTNFEEQTQSVEIVNVVQTASDTVYQDIILKYRKGMGNAGMLQTADAVFVQEIPAEAKRLYNQGVKDLAAKDAQGTEKGQDELDQAIKIFPDYYDALNALGCNYVAVQQYQKSFPYLIRAIDINQRSFSSYYSLGYAAFKVNRLPEASEAARAATILQPNSVNAQLLYGTVLRMTGNHDKSLETLLKAEKLSKDSPVAEVHWQLALTYNKLNRNNDAADELEKYLKADPTTTNKKQVEELIGKLRKPAKS